MPLVTFMLGLLIGIYMHTESTAKNQNDITFKCPEAPSLTCPEEHRSPEEKNLILTCYEKVSHLMEELSECHSVENRQENDIYEAHNHTCD
jgi:hypothetical protein